MVRELCGFPLSTDQQTLLKQHGFSSDVDVEELSAVELAKELNISPKKALDILNIVKDQKKKPSSLCRSAYNLLMEESTKVPIVTFCAGLDAMIGGGVHVGKITEICGAPGTGKTQLGIQLAVDAQIPEAFGGVEGETLYIDAEGSFIYERVRGIALAASTHIHRLAIDDDDGLKEEAGKFTVDKILSGIHVIRCHDYIQLLAVSHVLDDYIVEHPKIKLIVLDSVAIHFRHDFQDMALRTRLLQGLVQSFMKTAHEKQIAVVFMNQMTTKFNRNEEAKLVPALGQSWGHACTVRVLLDRIDDQRFAQLLKSPSHQEDRVFFDITKDGVRDADMEVPAKKQKVDDQHVR